MDIPHGALALAGGDELVVAFLEVAEADATFFAELGLRREGYVLAADFAELDGGVDGLSPHQFN